ncbi:DUF4932 domain-containing protein [Larkinella bovis]|uniref:DUF4932 domain-containing protein n=1 Tax=Larkinella bovis TaxID=683041 RepID=A0ABW0I7V6_9BACT
MKSNGLYLLFLLLGSHTFAQNRTIVRTKLNHVTIYINHERGNFNGVNEIPNPFAYSFGTGPETVPFAVVSEQDSIALSLQHGVKTTFQIIRETKGDTLICQFSAHKEVKAATFSDAYKTAHQGQTLIQIPEVYELINVIFALTRYGQTNAIYKETDYYRAVRKHFEPYRHQAAVRTIDSLLAQSEDIYAPLKMDSYAYAFSGDQIEKTGVYDRVSWGETNTLEPYIPLLMSFAKQSDYRTFFRKHGSYYASLVADFRQNVDVAAMKQWLEKQFPRTRYSAIKVIFTPLVGWNQSANSFSDNGFTEAQAHINFPFITTFMSQQPAAIVKGGRMLIVFTELNHSYLNPEADRYASEIAVAYQDLLNWITTGKPSGNYNNPLACFEEYMNYALVTLLYSDLFDKQTFQSLKTNLENNMVNQRGFRHFREFNEELLRLYQNRQPGQTVADLYPAIIAWSGQQKSDYKLLTK